MPKYFLQLGFSLYATIDNIKQPQFRKLLFILLSKYFQILLLVAPSRKFSIYHRLGIISLRNKNFNKAAHYSSRMDTLISSEDEHSRSLLFHANVLFEKGEYHVALNEYFNLIKVSRFKSLILSNIAFTYEIIGDVSNAQLYAKKSIEFSALEKDLAHTIDPSENLKNLIQ